MTFKEAKEVFLNRGYVPTNDGNNTIYDPDKWRNSIGVISRWLEQDPCDDVVSRQAMNECIETYCGSAVKLAMELRKLPSVQSRQKTGYWIPVSERLPEESITVLGTTEFDDLYKTELYDDCGEKKWYANGDFDVPIVAWMSLPESYNAESEV